MPRGVDLRQAAHMDTRKAHEVATLPDEHRDEMATLRDEMANFVPNWGEKSEVRTIPMPKGDDQRSMIMWAMSWHDIPLIISMTYACLPSSDHSFFRLLNWEEFLYAALINTMWVDQRTGLEYSLSFREASAVVAFFTGVRGGNKGCYLSGPYCCVSSGDFEEGNYESPGILFVKSLGFSPRDVPRRKITGYSTCNYAENEDRYKYVPPFICLPSMLQHAISHYADLTEGITALANKLAPCVQYREPDPEEKRKIEMLKINDSAHALSGTKRSRDAAETGP